MIWLVRTDNGESYDCRQEITIAYFTDKEKALAFAGKHKELRIKWYEWNEHRSRLMIGYPEFQTSHVITEPMPVLQKGQSILEFQRFFHEYKEKLGKASHLVFLERQEYDKNLEKYEKDMGIHSSQAPLYIGSDVWVEEVINGETLKY